MTWQNTEEPSGILIVNKPCGPTSHDVVNKIRKLYGTKRVGHTGTLDPMATGVLVVLVGRAAKASEYLSSDRKKYRAVLRLGIVTDTQDTTGKVLSEYNGEMPSQEDVKAVCETFIGKSTQIPPMYSALKVEGKKLVDLARKGIEVERQARPVEFFSIECNKITENEYFLDVSCSGGTYIRTLCHDIGEKLGCGGSMSSLCRTETGGFPIKKSHSLEELNEMSKELLEELLIPTEELFSSFPSVCLPEFYEKICRSGCEIYQKKINTSYETGTRVRICSKEGEFFALGEVFDYDDGSAIKAIKTFKLL